MIEKISRIYDVKPNGVDFTYDSFGIWPKQMFEEAQLGFRVDEDGNKIEDWIGDEYYVVGDNSNSDPIIVKVDDEKLPIYFMYHDNWDSLEKIANSIEDFSKIVKLIQETDLSNERKVKKLIKKVSTIAPKGCSQWQALIQGEHEFLVKNKK